jgi:uncharacterized cupredoxin-like copper-binding protein
VAMTKKSGIRLIGLLAVVALMTALSACSSSGSDKARPADDPAPPQVKVTLTNSGCSPGSFRLKPGYVTFVVTNPEAGDASGVGLHSDTEGRPTEMEIQDSKGHEVNEVEGVKEGTTRSFTLKLEEGKTYRVRCPEDQKPWGTITVVPNA